MKSEKTEYAIYNYKLKKFLDVNHFFTNDDLEDALIEHEQYLKKIIEIYSIIDCVILPVKTTYQIDVLDKNVAKEIIKQSK